MVTLSKDVVKNFEDTISLNASENTKLKSN